MATKIATCKIQKNAVYKIKCLWPNLGLQSGRSSIASKFTSNIFFEIPKARLFYNTTIIILHLLNGMN